MATQGSFKVTFDDLPDACDSWQSITSDEIAPLGTFSVSNDEILEIEPWRQKLSKDCEIDIFEGKWKRAEIVEARTRSLFGAPNKQFHFSWRPIDAVSLHVEKCSNASRRIAPPGTRTSPGKKSFGWAAVETERPISSYATVYQPYYANDRASSSIISRHGTGMGLTVLEDVINKFVSDRGIDIVFESLKKNPEVSAIVPSRTNALVKFLKALAGTVTLQSDHWLKSVGEKALQETKAILVNLGDFELRDFRSEDWRNIGICLRKILYASALRIEDAAAMLEKESLEVAFRFFKTTVLAQKIQGVKVIEEACHAVRESESYCIEAGDFANWLWTEVVPSLFDPRTTHKALIERSTDIVSLVLEMKGVDEHLINLLWDAASIETGATDADIRATVFDVLYYICPSIGSQSVADLIHRFASVDPAKLPPSAVELIRHLAASRTHYTKISHMALQFLWGVIANTELTVSDKICSEQEFRELKERIQLQIAGQERGEDDKADEANVNHSKPRRPPIVPSGILVSLPTTGNDQDYTSKQVPLPVLDAARRNFVKLVKIYELQHMRIPYALSCVELIEQDINTPLGLSILWEIIDSFNVKAIKSDEVTKDMIANFINSQSSLQDVVIQSCVRLHAKAQEWLAKEGKSQGTLPDAILPREAHYCYKDALEGRTGFLSNILSNTYLILNWEQISKLWSCLHSCSVCDLDRQTLMQFLQSACEHFGRSKFFTLEVAEKLYTEYIINSKEQLLSLDLTYFSCVRSYFLTVNEWKRSLDRAVGTSEQEVMIFQPPERMTGIWCLWKIALESKQAEVATAAIDFLLKLYTKLAPNFDEHMADKGENSVTTVDVKAAFVDRCVKKLQSSLEKLQEGDELAVARRALQALHRFLNDADTKGHGGLRPHYSRSGGRRLHLKFNSSVPPSVVQGSGGCAHFELYVSSSTSLWDIREAAASKVGLSPSKVKLIEGGKVLNDQQNTSSLTEIGLKNHAIILVNHQPPPRPQEAALLVNGSEGRGQARMTPALEEALTEIFSRFSKEGVMSKTLFQCYLVACYVGGSNISQERVQGIFNDHETTENGELTLGGFLEFYKRGCLEREESVRKDLRHHGYDTRTLRLKNDAKRRMLNLGEIEKAVQAKGKTENLPKGVSPEVAAVAAHYGVDLSKEETSRPTDELHGEADTQNNSEETLDFDEVDDDTIRSNPRLVLTMNPDYFDTLFDALSAPHSVSFQAWELLQRLPTNPTILKGLESVDDYTQSLSWSQLLPEDESSHCKLLYTLQIVNGFLEDNIGDLVQDVTMSKNEAVTSSNDPDKPTGNNGDEQLCASRTSTSGSWRTNFVRRGGLSHLLKVTNQWKLERLWSHNAYKDGVMVAMRRFCLSALLRIICDFIVGSVLASSTSIPFGVLTFSSVGVADDWSLSLHSDSETLDDSNGTASATDANADDPGVPTVSYQHYEVSADSNPANISSVREECKICNTKSSLEMIVEELSEQQLAAEILSSDVINPLHSTIERVIDYVCYAGNTYDVALMRQALAIWLAVCLERQELAYQQLDKKDQMARRILGLVLCPFSRNLRNVSAHVVYFLCRYVLPMGSRYLRDEITDVLLDKTRSLLADPSNVSDDSVIKVFSQFSPDASVLSCCSKEFFSLLNALLVDAISQKSDVVRAHIRTGGLGTLLLNWLSHHEPVERRLLATDKENEQWKEAEWMFDWKRIPTGDSSLRLDITSDEDCVLIGILQMLSVMLRYMPSILQEDWNSFDGCGKLLSILLERCLFYVPESLEDLDESERAKLPMCSRSRSRSVAFQLLMTICSQQPERAADVAECLIPILNRSSKVNSFRYTPSSAQRNSCGYVGLRNLGCICYMNSMLQQLFMIPRFRYGILDTPALVDVGPQLRDDIDRENKKLRDGDVQPPEEDMLYQLQRLFGFLCLSDRQDYNPKPFCHVFRPLGEPVNVLQQQDAEEFVTFFMDMVDNVVKGTRQEKLVKEYLTGSTITQIVDPSNERILSERQEPFHHLTLTVKNHKNVEEALESLIQGETIEDYHYEPEDVRMTITRRSLIGRLPANLVLHCKRFEFNLETFQVDKINSRFEFPHTLSLWPYTKQGCDRRTETDQMKDYEYRLAGVVCHVGTAGAGHYYSFIRDRINGLWYEFNDSIVRPFDPAKLEEETFGGSSVAASFPNSYMSSDASMSGSTRNAYLLIYDKVIPQEGTVDALKLESSLRHSRYDVPDKISDPPRTPPLINADDKGNEEQSVAKGGPNVKEEPAEFSLKLRQLASCLDERPPGSQTAYQDQKGCRGRDVIPEKLQRSTLWRCLLPPSVLEEVFDDNVRFLVDQSIYCTEFFDFMSIAFKNFEEILSSHSNVDDENRSVTQLSRVFVPFALDTLAHASENKTFATISDAMLGIVTKRNEAALELLGSLISSPSSYAKVLLECSDTEIRRGISKLIVACVNSAMSSLEEQNKVRHDVKTLLKYRTEQNGKSISAGSCSWLQSTIGKFFHVHLENLVSAVSNIYRCEQYFEIFAESAEVQPLVRWFLLAYGCVELLVDGFLEDSSPFQYVRSSGRKSLRKDKPNTPLWTKMLQTVSLLIRSVHLPDVVREGTGAAAETASALRKSRPQYLRKSPAEMPDPMEASLDHELLKKAYEGKLHDILPSEKRTVAPVALMISSLLTCSSFFEKALKNSAESKSSTLLLQHLCWENPNFTNIACQAVSDELMFSSQCYTVDLHFDVVEGLLELDDSLQPKRVAMILGDPHIAMPNRGAYVGYGLASINEDCRDILFRKDNTQIATRRTTLLNGVGRGLLAGMYNRRYSSGKWVYACLARLVSLMERIDPVRFYVWTIPAPKHLHSKRGYTFWADWFYMWLFRYCEGLTATPQPDEQEVLEGVAYLKKLIYIRDKADEELGRHRPRLSETPSLAFYIKRLDGEVISHSYNSDVTCTAHAWTDPESTERMAFKVVNDKRQGMVFRLSIEESRPGTANFDLPENLPVVVTLGYREVKYLHPVVKKDPEAEWGGFSFSWRYELLKDEKENDVLPADTESDDEIPKNDEQFAGKKIQPMDDIGVDSQNDSLSDEDNDSTNAKASLEGDNNTPPPSPPFEFDDEAIDLKMRRSDSEIARDLERQLNDNDFTGGELVDFNPDPHNPDT